MDIQTNAWQLAHAIQSQDYSQIITLCEQGATMDDTTFIASSLRFSQLDSALAALDSLGETAAFQTILTIRLQNTPSTSHEYAGMLVALVECNSILDSLIRSVSYQDYSSALYSNSVDDLSYEDGISILHKAYFYEASQQYIPAEYEYLYALQAFRRTIGEYHYDYIQTQLALTELYIKMRAYDKAEIILQHELKKTHLLGLCFRDLHDYIQLTLARLYELQSLKKEADFTLRDLVTTAQKDYGERSFQYLKYLTYYAEFSVRAENAKKAESLYKRLKNIQSTLPYDLSEYMVFDALKQVYFRKHLPYKLYKLYKTCPSTYRTPTTDFELAYWAYATNQIPTATKFFTQALASTKSTSLTNDQLACAIHLLSCIYLDKIKDSAQALLYIDSLLSSRRSPEIDEPLLVEIKKIQLSALYAQEDTAAVQRLVADFLEHIPMSQYPYLYVTVAEYYKLTNDTLMADSLYRNLVQAVPDGSVVQKSVLDEYVQFLLKIQNYDKALWAYERINAINQDLYGVNSHIYLLDKGTYCRFLWESYGKHKEALRLQLELTDTIRTLFKDAFALHCHELNNVGLIYADMPYYTADSHQKNTQQAIHYIQQALQVSQRAYGFDYYHNIALYNNLAYLYADIDSIDQALSYYHQATQLLYRIAGKQNPIYVTQLDYTAPLLYQNKKDYPTALQLIEERKRITTHLFGKNSVHYVYAQQQEADLYYYQGNYAKVTTIYEDALRTMNLLRNTKGDDYVRFLQAYAYFCKRIENYEKAMRLCDEALAWTDSTVEQKTKTYVNTLFSIACLKQDMGLENDNLEYLMLAAADFQKVAQLMNSMDNDFSSYDKANVFKALGDCYQGSHEYEQAILLYEQTKLLLDSSDQVKFRDYPTWLRDMAVSNECAGHLERALQLYLERANLRKQLSGDSSEEYLSDILDIAAYYYNNTKQVQEATHYLDVAKGISISLYGENSTKHIQTLAQYGLMYYAFEEYALADSIYRECLDLEYALVEDSTSSDIIQLYRNLAYVNKQMGNFPQTVAYFQLALDKQKRLSGKYSEKYIQALLRLGYFYYHNTTQYAICMDLLTEAKAIADSIYHYDNSTLLNIFNLTANVYHDMGQYANAAQIHTSILTTAEHLYGKRNNTYVTFLHNLAHTYHSMGEFHEADSLYKEAIQLRLLYPQGRKQYLSALISHADFYQDFEKYELAEEEYKVALAYSDSVYGRQSESSGRIIIQLGRSLSNKGDIEQGRRMFKAGLDIWKELGLDLTQDYLMNSYRYALCCSNLKDYAEFATVTERVIAEQVRLFGYTHMNLPEFMLTYAYYIETIQKDAASAEAYYISILDVCEKMLHLYPNIYTLYLQKIIRKTDLSSLQLKLLPTLLATLETTEGKNSTTYVEFFGYFIGAEENMALYEQAKSHYVELIELARLIFGTDNNAYLRVINKYAKLLDEQFHEYDTVIELYDEMIAIMERMGEIQNRTYMETWNQKGLTYSKKGIESSAELCYNKAIDVAKEVFGNSRTLADLIYNVGVSYFNLGKYALAETKLDEAIQVYDQVYENRYNKDHAEAIFLKARAQKGTKKYTAAIETFQMYSDIIVHMYSETSIDYVLAQYALGKCYESCQKYDEALQSYSRAAQVVEKSLIQYLDKCIPIYQGMMSIYTARYDFTSAESQCKRLIALSDKVYGSTAYPHYAFLLELAKIVLLTHNYAKAEPLFIEVIDAFSSGESYHMESMLEAGTILSFVYNRLGKYAQAETLLKRLISTGSPSSYKYPGVIEQYAELEYDLGNYDQAEQLLLQYKSICKNLFGEAYDNSGAEVQFLPMLAKVKAHQMHYQEADSLFALAAQMAETLQLEDDLQRVYILWSMLKVQLRDYAAAEQLLSYAIETEEKQANARANRASLYEELGKLYMKTDRAKEAIQILGKGYDILRKYQSNGVSAQECLLLQGMAYIQQNDYKHASKIIESDASSRRIYIENQFDFMSESQRSMYWNSVSDIFANRYMAYAYHFANKYPKCIDFAYNNALYQKGLLLNTSQKIQSIILSGGDTALIANWYQLCRIKQSISELQVKSDEEQRAANMDQLKTEAEALDKQIMQKCAVYRNRSKKLECTFRQVEKSLQDNETTIEFISFNPNPSGVQDSTIYCALLLRKGYRHPIYIRLFEEKEITPYISSNVNDIYAYTGSGQSLFNLIWSKLQPYLRAGDKVYYAPMGVLYQINLAALPISETETMGDVYDMELLSSTREIAATPTMFSPKDVALYGGISYDKMQTDEDDCEEVISSPAIDNMYATRGLPEDSLSRSLPLHELTGAEQEVMNINTLLTTYGLEPHIYQAHCGSEESFKALSGRSVNILHLATHGFFWSNSAAQKQDFFSNQSQNTRIDPMQRSGLLLAGANTAYTGHANLLPPGVQDGILTAKEISCMDLNKTDIVVLSACETAKGDITSEGVFGLQRAFKMAGVQTIIMTLWKVDDLATSLLMVEFYKNWLSSKHSSKHQAFQNAITTIRNMKDEDGDLMFNKPYFWAGFIMLD